jgi:glycosyltransferase involved in cell wall biosynthesis
MVNLSVVIITFNEELNIERCIKSVRTVADEIVVIDSFSTDKTEEICRKEGVNFIKHKFEGHIEQKNWAITQAKYPHILSIDADEALSEDLIKSINEVKTNWTKDGYSMNRLTNYCGKWIKHCGWYPDIKLRLWDSTKGKWGGINPHDKYELTQGCSQAHLKGDLYHFSYYTIQQHITQVNKFTDILSNAMFEKGKHSSLFKILFNPIVKFIKDYIILLGFLDGYHGFVICRISAHATFLKYAKLKQLHSKKVVK